MKNKVIILIIGILLLCGCTEITQEDIEKEHIDIYIDKDTCVEYFINYAYPGRTVITPKYDKNGNIKLNKQCLKEQE